MQSWEGRSGAAGVEDPSTARICSRPSLMMIVMKITMAIIIIFLKRDDRDDAWSSL